jgi:hypothetical protein
MHNTLAAVQQRSHSVVTGSSRGATNEECGAAGLAEEEQELGTVQLRRQVNANLQTQLGFFTECMTAWAGSTKAECPFPHHGT